MNTFYYIPNIDRQSFRYEQRHYRDKGVENTGTNKSGNIYFDYVTNMVSFIGPFRRKLLKLEFCSFSSLRMMILMYVTVKSLLFSRSVHRDCVSYGVDGVYKHTAIAELFVRFVPLLATTSLGILGDAQKLPIF